MEVEEDEEGVGGRMVLLVGATGVGKTRLANALAKKWASIKKKVVVANVDALQRWDALPIATARKGGEGRGGEEDDVERALFAYRSVDGVEEEEEEDDVRQFRETFLRVAADALATSGVVLAVGGTAYYARAVASKRFLTSRSVSEEEEEEEDGECRAVDSLTNEEKKKQHEQLREIDAKAASKLHPNDARRVRRCLRMAKMAKTEADLPSAKMFSSSKLDDEALMFPGKTRVVHVIVEKEALESTLNARLEKMRCDGVEEEIKEFIAKYPELARSNRGAAQAIGVREFLEEETVEDAFERMRARTKRLARRQKKQFANMSKDLNWPTLEIDTTKMHVLTRQGSEKEAMAFWEDEVVTRAFDFVSQPLSATIKRRALLVIKEADDVWVERTCEACGVRVFRGDKEWLVHVSSKRHRNRVYNSRRIQNGKCGIMHPKYTTSKKEL